MLIQDTVIICGNADFWSMAVGADANLIRRADKSLTTPKCEKTKAN